MHWLWLQLAGRTVGEGEPCPKRIYKRFEVASLAACETSWSSLSGHPIGVMAILAKNDIENHYRGCKLDF